MHSLLEERWGEDLIHIAYWEVRLQLQRQYREFGQWEGGGEG